MKGVSTMVEEVKQIAQRIYGMRILLGFTEEEMADVCGVTLEEYRKCESGTCDYSFTFLLKCAQKFGIDMSELITGDMPKLSQFTIVRRGRGLPIKRRQGFDYQHLAGHFKKRMSEPFVVTAKYSKADEEGEIAMSTHEGQEFDYILSGSLKIQIDGHTDVLYEGDSVFYDSGIPHGMVASGGKDCQFIAVVMKPLETDKK